jgi:threonine/homoserine/homoserine lactone efflux protein
MSLELVGILGSAFLVGLTGAVAPGPLLALDIRESVRLGVRAGVLVSTGHAVADLAMVMALAVGISRIVDTDLALAIIGPVGGGFLLWMGWTMARNAPVISPWSEGHVPPPARSTAYPLLGGALVSVANPFWWLWWLTVGSAFLVSANPQGQAGTYTFYVGHILADYVWYIAVAAALGSGRRFMSDSVYRMVMVISAGLLGLVGIVFVVQGIVAAVS